MKQKGPDIMKIKEIYPKVPKKKIRRAEVIKVLRWPLVLAGLFCLAIDMLDKTLSWSLIASVSIYIVWTFFISPDMVEVNGISIMIKAAAWVCALFFTIDKAVTWKGSGDVISIVCSSAMIVTFILFASDKSNRRSNMFPMMLLCLVSLSFSIPSFLSRAGAGKWFYGVSGIIAALVFITSLIILGGSFFSELKKRFHTK